MEIQSSSPCRVVRSRIRVRSRRPSARRYLHKFGGSSTRRAGSVAVPVEQVILVDDQGQRLDVDALVEALRREPQRILADDEVGLVLYVGDLNLYTMKPTESGEFLASPVTEISRPRFSSRMLRKQIGATVLSVTADAVFVVREGNVLKKVRAEKLERGMVLASGEKVYR